MKHRSRPLTWLAALALNLVLCSAAMKGQERARETADASTAPIAGVPAAEATASTLPDAPGSAPGLTELEQQNTDASSSGAQSSVPPRKDADEGMQTKRILYIIPNFRAVSADQHLPPQTVGEKFKTAALDSVDYSSFIFVAIQSGIAQARNATPEFHQGAAGYGRYYWHTYADYVNENLWVEFIFPAVLHQDSRYYTLGSGGFAKRFAYSVSRIAITRTDSGHEAFNASEILGAGAAAGISSLYYPSQDRTFNKTFELWMTSLAIDGGSSLFKEFWPDINNKFFHQKD
jgi:hypothetical protein